MRKCEKKKYDKKFSYEKSFKNYKFSYMRIMKIKI